MKVSSFFGLSVLSLALALTGCKKTETDDLSRIKSYPSIQLIGDEVTVVNRGEVFTDPGVTANLAGQALTPVKSGSVNTAVTGVYLLEYKGANTEGDTVSTVRSVVVTDPVVNSLDQSGTFQRSGFAVSPVTKIGTKGLYQIGNFGFTSAPNLFPAYFVQVNATTIVVPPQTIPGLGFTTFASINPVFTAGRLTTITYAINAPGIFGNAPRSAIRL